ncbi:hypothetical protein D3C76_1587240 [compost metagenome]
MQSGGHCVTKSMTSGTPVIAGAFQQLVNRSFAHGLCRIVTASERERIATGNVFQLTQCSHRLLGEWD